jgi:competence protein ComEC
VSQGRWRHNKAVTSRYLGHRAPLLWLVLPVMAGLAAGKIGVVAPVSWQLAGALAAGIFAVVASWRFPVAWRPAIVLTLFLAGGGAYLLQRARLPAWDALPAREARLTLRVDRVFTPREGKKASGLATIVRAPDFLPELRGQRIYFSLDRRPGEALPVRSAVIAAVGVLVTLPRNPPTESFDSFLADAGMNFRLTRGRILAEIEPAHAYYRFCASGAARFKEILGRGIEEKRPTLTALLRAMMLGETHELSEEQRTLFMQSGTMHLFAISGLNIGVIAGAMQALLALLRLPGWARFVAGALLLGVFVDITGASPSAVRAFVMAVFMHAAFVWRQPANPLAALIASAALVLALAPLQLFSASFIMSYGIVSALLVLGLPLGEAWQTRWPAWRDLPPATWRRWHHMVDTSWRWGSTTVAIGVATTLVALITGVQFFRLMTPGALAANLVLIPTAMGATLAGFASLVCGLLGFGAGATLCNHAAAMVLLLIEWLVHTSVQLPGAYLPAHFAPAWAGMAGLSLLMAALFGGYAAHWRRERGGWWPPFAVVALALIFGMKFD